VSLSVSALAAGRNGAGYMQQLWRLMDGGMHLVRFEFGSPIWWQDTQVAQAVFGGTAPLSWTTGGNPLGWTTGGNPLAWFTGPAMTGTAGTDALGFATISLTGLPPGVLIVRPGDVVRSFGGAGGVARAVRAEMTDGAGAVTIRLDAVLPSGVINLHDADSAVFEVLNMTRAAQPVNGDWQISLDLREVLPEEYAGATEVNPWH
jgi:hypothetical protein